MRNINKQVVDLIKDNYVIFVSTGWGASNIGLKQELVEFMFNNSNINLKSIKDKNFIVFDKTDTIAYSKLLQNLSKDFNVIVIDDSPTRLNKAKENKVGIVYLIKSGNFVIDSWVKG